MVLIFTHSQDYYNVDLVADYLQKKGIESFRLNTDDFPLKYHISSSFPAQNNVITVNDKEIDLDRVTAIWLRKFWGPKFDIDIDEKYRSACYKESLETLKGLFYATKNIFWMDALDAVQLAGNKMYQLQIASETGLKIPNTLVTNNPKKLESFYIANNKNVVAKMQTTLSTSMNAEGEFFYTTKLTDNDVLDAEMLSLTPMTFQQEVIKEYELRIAYVDGNFFTGKLTTTDNLTDTRVAQNDKYSWEPYELPVNLKNKLHTFMKKINLYFGAIDIIKSVNGTYYFLEVNPTGEWGMMQKQINLPIAEAIAESLIKKSLITS